MINQFTKSFKRSVTAVAVSLTLGTALPAVASVTSGYITGVVSSAAGDNLDGATIKIRNKSTGLVREGVSDKDGKFRFPNLPEGTYQITIDKNGFESVLEESINVGIGGRVNLNIPMQTDGTERIEVRGSSVAMVDVTSNTTGIVVDQFVVEKIPVPRDLTGVALLAPGTTQGDSAFGNQPSIGGASVAENAYYVNGLNITNFRTGVGSSEVPFEFYDQFEVKTGGYSAEFGRATGGVINASVKRGSNDFHYGINGVWEPDSLAADKPNVNIDGVRYQTNDQDEQDNYDVNMYVSGAIIKDKLFYYALFNPRKRSDTYNSSGLNDRSPGGTLYEDETDDNFWGGKIDWYITDNQILELTAFSDERTVVRDKFDYDLDTGKGDSQGTEYRDRGGDNFIAKYTAIVNEDLSISAQYGLNKYDRTNYSAGDEYPAIYDSRQGGLLPMGQFETFAPSEADDERETGRIDVDWYLGDHELRFGVDYEKLTAFDQTQYSGGIYWRYFNFGDGDLVRERIYKAGGEFEVENSAFYIQDAWQVTDNLILNLGIRNDTFDNKNADGNSFVKLEDQWAPRLGFVWDVNGDGESKAWASFGRYYLGVAANTNIRLSGAELFTQQWFELNGINSDDTPIKGDAITDLTVFGDGTVPNEAEIVDANIDPMYSDEFQAGYHFQLNDEWSVGIQGTYRELKVTIEDVAIDKALNDYAANNGYDDFHAGGFDYYVLTNPGNDMDISIDMDGDGTLEQIELSKEQLGYPESIRKYGAVDLTFARAWDGKWMMNAAYTWSHSWGNNEGSVRSDNGQDDAGLTTLFDQPGLLDGADGNLPNDRRHAVKVFGAYSPVENITLGANFFWQSGRPLNAFGIHPTDEFAQAYGAESFYKQGVLAPRGSEGETSSRWNLDLSANYDMMWMDHSLNFRLDVFNVFNNDKATEIYEIADDEFYFESTHEYRPDNRFGAKSNFQTPRYVRLSASVRF